MTVDEDEDEAAAEAAPTPRRRRAVPRIGRLRWWLIGGSALVLVPLVGLWIERKPIAASYVDQMLAEKGVKARYHIADLGLGRQRLTNLVIGDPAHPDLVADWVELSTDIGLTGASVTAVRAGQVRLRGKLVDGTLSLGAIDRLLPPPSGKPFALPALDVTVDDARMHLETPYGVVGLKAAGRGRLDDGFSGHVTAVAETLALSGCTADRLVALLRVSITDARPTLTGPLSAGTVTCGDTKIDGARSIVAATLGERLDRWQGRARLRITSARTPAAQAHEIAGSVDFEGSPSRTSGSVDLATGAVVSADVAAARLSLAGGYRVENGFLAFQGSAGARNARLADAWRVRIGKAADSAQGSPVGPLMAKLVEAGAAATRDFDVTANIDALQAKGQGRIGVSRLIVHAASGASATLASGDGVQVAWPDRGLRIDGLLTLEGGGMPSAAVQLHQERARGPMTGNALIRPYAADGASLALTPVRFTANPDGSTHFSTTATLSGPLGDGRIENARMPIDGAWNGAGRLLVNRQCAPLSFDHLAVSSLVLDPTRLTLCPSGGALLAVNGVSLSGGARLAATHLEGRLGQTPLSLDASGAELALAKRGFVLSDVAARLGAEDSQTRIDAAHLDGHMADGAVAGTFSGAGGRIGTVPLILSDAAGDWRFAAGKLALTGGLTVSDAAEEPRFKPLVSHDVAFDLAANRIAATGTLAEPETGTRVADVRIGHDLSTGTGDADLTVPGITFGDGFQPSQLTRLTYGVIADVKGTVKGQGHIAWSPDGVTSTGTFGTDDTDLAAAFGPVEGLATQIRFTDLLNLVSAPGQVATVASVNPGVAATEGVIHYRILNSTQVQVDGGKWPFAGGALVLEPTLLDFGEHQQKRLTFTITGMDAAQFLQQFDFKNLTATGVFDGTLPMVFDETGGRIENGHLTVREGGGSLAYVGEVSQHDLGTWGNMAFQALKALEYKNLTITMNGPLAGEMVTEVRFAGVSQGEGTKSNFLIKRLAKLPFIFNVKIRAPFRGLLDSAQSLYDPTRLIQRNLPALIKQQNEAGAPAPSTTPADRPIQPTESETVP
ncbi:MAG TPA: YdbH domain-containing protein [Sphingomonas sp.]|nr:YdbH domain-containing protein [Sphingomonas sp.]